MNFTDKITLIENLNKLREEARRKIDEKNELDLRKKDIHEEDKDDN